MNTIRNAKLENAVKIANESANGRWDIFASLDPAVYIVVFTPTGDTPYSGGVFFADLYYIRYPNYPPRVKMTTPIYHPNYCRQSGHEGNLYSDKLYEGFNRTMNVKGLVEYIYNLFYEPDMAGLSVSNVDAANLYRNNRAEFNKRAKLWTQLYAT